MCGKILLEVEFKNSRLVQLYMPQLAIFEEPTPVINYVLKIEIFPFSYMNLLCYINVEY